MGDFHDVTLSRVPAGFDFPEPLQLLFAWVEEQGFVTRWSNGELIGTLGMDDSVGTQIVLRGYRPDECLSLHAWFGSGDESPERWLWPFARTGRDGSMAALWNAVDGVTRIVHLGSGSGSMLTCVLAENAIDFLRLLAIGYDEICWNWEFNAPPKPCYEAGQEEVVNAQYRAWITSTFGVSIPTTALEIVADPAEMGDKDTTDPFCRLVNQLPG